MVCVVVVILVGATLPPAVGADVLAAEGAAVELGFLDAVGAVGAVGVPPFTDDDGDLLPVADDGAPVTDDGDPLFVIDVGDLLSVPGVGVPITTGMGVGDPLLVADDGDPLLVADVGDLLSAADDGDALVDVGDLLSVPGVGVPITTGMGVGDPLLVADDGDPLFVAVDGDPLLVDDDGDPEVEEGPWLPVAGVGAALMTTIPGDAVGVGL